MWKRAFIESDISPQQLLHHIMGNGSGTNVFDDDLHLGIIREASILLLEAEMCWVKVEDKRGRAFGELLEDVRRRFDYDAPDGQYAGAPHVDRVESLPYGSGHLFPARRSLSMDKDLNNGFCNRAAWSPGFCASFLGRF